MSCFRLIHVFPIALVACLFSSHDVQAETFSDKDHHFSVDLPPGWTVMSDSELSRINSFAGSRMLGQISYVQGFRRRGSAPGTFPYALVQFQAGAMNASYEEIESSIARDLPGAVKKAEGSFSDLTKNVSLGNAVLDRSNNRIIIRMKMDLPGIGAAQVMSVGHISSEGIVFVHSYAKDDNFSSYLKTFTDMNDSFEYDKGYTLTPSEGFWQRLTGGGLSGAARGGIAGGRGRPGDRWSTVCDEGT
jgi:hypothetical protein